jgi:hypothetical protein
LEPFLSGLGVTDIEQARNPVSSTFPLSFNTNCQPIWDAVVTHMDMGKDVGKNWQTAIRLYIEICVTEDQYPFSNLKQSANDQILTLLTNERRSIVKFLNASKMLDYVNLRATSRQVTCNNIGFVLTVFGKIALKDPTFEKWLTKIPIPRFNVVKDNGRYIKHLTKHTTMVVYNEGASMSGRWHIGYEIVCHHFPDLPGNQLASKAEMEKFILDILYMPILKQHRPLGYHRRLI